MLALRVLDTNGWLGALLTLLIPLELQFDALLAEEQWGALWVDVSFLFARHCSTASLCPRQSQPCQSICSSFWQPVCSISFCGIHVGCFCGWTVVSHFQHLCLTSLSPLDSVSRLAWFFSLCVLAKLLLACSNDTELFTTSQSAAIQLPIFHFPPQGGHILISSFYPEILPRVRNYAAELFYHLLPL